MRIAIVLGTSRREGNTAKLVNDFISNCEHQVSFYQLSDFIYCLMTISLLIKRMIFQH